MAKQLLEMFGFDYEAINIEQDSEAREWLLNEGHRSVPQIYVNEHLVEGGFSGLKGAGKAGITVLMDKAQKEKKD